MTRPDEIAALADKLVFAAENTQGCLYSQRKMLKEAAAALRASATLPGDAVLVTDEMVKAALISLHKNPVSWEHPNTVRAALEAALAPAEKAGDSLLTKLLAATGCKDTDDLRDMAQIGQATMAAMEVVTESDGPFKGWTPAECPSEIITDLFSMLMDDTATPTPPSADVAKKAYAALFEPAESDAIDNLEGALIDIKRLSDAGKPTDAVCIRTIERVQQQLIKAHEAFTQSAAHGGGTKSDGACLSSLPSGESEPLVTMASAPSDTVECPDCGGGTEGGEA